jgi:hypothetical protein
MTAHVTTTPDCPDVARRAFDVDAVAPLFAAAWRTDVDGCRLVGVRYAPARGCTATYAVARRDGPSTIGVLDVSAAGTAVRRYDEDPALPGLASAADPSTVATVLGTVMDVRNCAVAPVRYRPGQRALLRYDVETPAGPQVLFGKVVTDPGRVAEGFAFVHRAAQLAPAPLTVAAGLGLVVLPCVAGPTLHAAAFDRTRPIGDRTAAFRETGRAVAGLHAVPPPAGCEPTDPAAEVRREGEALRALDGALADRWEAVLSVLRTDRRVQDAPVPSHGALRTDQVVLSDHGPVLVDLDGFGVAAPAADVANLLAYLRWRRLRVPDDAAIVGAGRDALLEGYAGVHPVPADDEVAAHEALSLLKIAARRYTNLATAEWTRTPELVAEAARLAERAR